MSKPDTVGYVLLSTERRQQWAGAGLAITVQSLIFTILYYFINDFIAASAVLLINIGLAARPSQNTYWKGARWSSFWNLGLASYARHGYWYENFLASFEKMRNFETPLAPLAQLPPGTWEDIYVVGITSTLIVIFYYYVSLWPEWTSRWELLRRAPFSASLGMQSLIFVTIAYPTPLSMASAILFSALISPIMRRQVRFNHVIFLILLPLLALGSPALSLWVALLAGLLFLSFVVVERALTPKVASFTFFMGVTFIALFISMVESRLTTSSSGLQAGLISLLSFAATVSLAFLLAYKHQLVTSFFSRAYEKIPSRWLHARWWAPRELWVDREIDCRVNKRYTFKNTKIDLGLFFFGPKEWPAESANYEKVQHSPINFTPAIIVLAFYSIWLWLDTVLALTNETLSVTVGGLLLGFALTLWPLARWLKTQLRHRQRYSRISIFANIFSLGVFTILMGLVMYFGLMPSAELPEPQPLSKNGEAVVDSIPR